jgi:hypothetical protein
MKKILPLFLILLVSFSCTKDSEEVIEPVATLPTITTTACSSITVNSAISGGNITSDGGATITSRGVCWSTNSNPTISDNKTIETTGTGIYSSTITELTENTTYHVRAYATNKIGTAYGSDVSFTTLTIPVELMYFPPLTGDSWETKSIADLEWNQAAVQPLLDYLELKHSKSFIVLVNGRIVLENYFNGHTATTPWYWASAGKTLTSTVTGIAQQEGLLNINNKVSDYLGTGWTSAPIAKENLITCKNLLSMNSGLNDALGDDVSPANLQ